MALGPDCATKAKVSKVKSSTHGVGCGLDGIIALIRHCRIISGISIV